MNLPTCLRLLLTTLLLLALPAHAAGADLNGVWNGFRVVHKGNSVKFINDKGWPEAEEPPGVIGIHGTFDGRNLVGKILIMRLKGNHTNAYRKSVCGKNWKEYVDIRLTLSADGNTLSGKWLSQPNNEKTCALTGQPSWVPTSFTRKAPVAAEPPKPAELPKVEEAPKPPPAPEPPKLEEAPGGKGSLIGGLALLVAAVVGFFIRNAYVNYLVGSLKRSPNNAGLAGWMLFGGLLFGSALVSVALINSAWMTLPVLGGLGGLAAVCFGLCALFSAKK